MPEGDGVCRIHHDIGEVVLTIPITWRAPTAVRRFTTL